MTTDGFDPGLQEETEVAEIGIRTSCLVSVTSCEKHSAISQSFRRFLKNRTKAGLTQRSRPFDFAQGGLSPVEWPETAEFLNHPPSLAMLDDFPTDDRFHFQATLKDVYR